MPDRRDRAEDGIEGDAAEQIDALFRAGDGYDAVAGLAEPGEEAPLGGFLGFDDQNGHRLQFPAGDAGNGGADDRGGDSGQFDDKALIRDGEFSAVGAQQAAAERQFGLGFPDW
jgi:hypothetical protein